MSGALDRRTFLERASVGLSALAIAPRIASARSQRVLIVGAGMAGLSTGLQLVASGHDITILEARTRPGGRVYTLREPFADGLYAEAGAMQVFDSHTRAQRYIQELGLEIDPI